MLDLLIVNGWVVDGSGADGYRAAVGVDGDTVRIFRGDVAGVQAARSIDATGRVVCPGFIDMHAHSGLMMLAHPDTRTRRSGRPATSPTSSASTPGWTAIPSSTSGGRASTTTCASSTGRSRSTWPM